MVAVADDTVFEHRGPFYMRRFVCGGTDRQIAQALRSIHDAARTEAHILDKDGILHDAALARQPPSPGGPAVFVERHNGKPFLQRRIVAVLPPQIRVRRIHSDERQYAAASRLVHYRYRAFPVHGAAERGVRRCRHLLDIEKHAPAADDIAAEQADIMDSTAVPDVATVYI